MKDSVSMFLTSYQDELKHSVSLPKRISDQFELYDCLHATEIKSTYIIRNRADNTLAVLKVAAMLYSQLFNTLCDKALSYGGRLPVHVTCLLDEFANQKIPNFERLISVIRSRN